MFKFVEKGCEVIFCILGIEKTILDSYLIDVLSGEMAMTTHNLSGRLKKYFESMFQRVEGHTN
jgi:hypothetical protein